MKLIAMMALLLPTASATQSAVGPSEAPATPLPRSEARAVPSAMPNLLGAGGPDCPSFSRQIADLNKRRARDGHRLDREPAAHLFLTVDRHVDGCREPTLIRRNIGPARPEPRR